MDDIELTCLCDLFFQSEEDISSTYLHLHECVNTIPLLSSTLLNKKSRQRKARVTNRVEAILPMCRMDDFRDRFRINMHTFESLVTKLAPYLMHGDQDGSVKTTVENQLLIYVKYVSTQLTLQSIADLFGVCEATVFNLVKRILSVI